MFHQVPEPRSAKNRLHPDLAASDYELELTATIGAFIDHWNEHPRPFAWTKDADDILASIKRAKTKANVLTNH
jgi:hypothetical protein